MSHIISHNIKKYKYYMSLSNWKRLAQKRTETGKMKNQLYDEITEEKIKSKTSDQRITKSFRLDEIIDGLKHKSLRIDRKEYVPAQQVNQMKLIMHQK